MEKVKKIQVLSKDLILAEAKELFSQKGYRGTTIKDLTIKFNVSRPALYYHFKNKVEILSELHSTAFNELVKNFDEIISPKISLKDKFRKVIENHAYVVARNAKLVKIFFQDDREIPKKMRNKIRKRRKDYTDKLIELYKQGINEGLFKNTDPKIAVYLILGTCNWLCMWYSDKRHINPDNIVEFLINLLCGGYQRE